MASELEEIDAVLNGLRSQLYEVESTTIGVSHCKFVAGLSLTLSAFDMAVAMVVLLRTNPEASWVSAHLLQRSQIEHYIRGMFFLGPATETEAERFLEKSQLPKRDVVVGKGKKKRSEKRTITHSEMLDEVADHFKLPGTLRTTHDATWRVHNDLVHGGRVVAGIYFRGNEFGPASMTPENLVGMLCNPLVTALAAFATLPDIGFESLRNETVYRLLDRGRVALEIAAKHLDAACGLDPTESNDGKKQAN